MSRQADPGTDRWSVLHANLQDLLAGYADEMLPPDQIAVVEAHLTCCEACRNDVARQRTLSRRLSGMPAARMSVELTRRIDQALADAAPTQRPLHRRLLFSPDWLRHRSRSWFALASGWLVALVLAVVMLTSAWKAGIHDQIPMIHDAVAQYRQMAAQTLPSAADMVDVQPPANWPDARLLATWHTDIGGAPAQAFAMRSGHSVVIQYRIDEAVFFRNPAVRAAVAKSGMFQTHEGGTEILALPASDAGVLLVGPTASLPTRKQLRLNPS